jgi:hypothetical protein
LKNINKNYKLLEGGEGRELRGGEGGELSFQCLRPSTSLMAAGKNTIKKVQNREGRIENIKKIIIAAGILSEHTCFVQIVKILPVLPL